MKGFYSPIDRLMEQSTRPRGTGAEYMAELSKKPGYKPQEAEDRDLQALMALPKMERTAFMEKLKAKSAVMPEESTFAESILKNRGLNVVPDVEPHHEDYTLPGGTNYREILLQHPEGTFPGVEAHFGGAPNVLASIRAKDRVGPNGEKILHLEEIQSDWHQQGREKGYHPKGVDMDKTLAAAKNKHSTLQRQLQDAKANATAVEQRKAAAVSPEVQALHDRMLQGYNRSIMDLMPQVMRADEELRKTQQLASRGVPDAPFKKDWHELALKKMIHHAAENGYDQIAITPGAEQAKRYGLSKHVDELRYGDGMLVATKGGTIVTNKETTPAELSDLVGKEVAGRLLNSPTSVTGSGYNVLSGQDLDIGGEGMKGFYDKMVPAFLNKFGKKHGVQVQPGSVSIVSTPAQHHGLTESQFQAQSPDEQQRMVRQHAYAYQGAKTEAPVHTFNITPQMREDVLKNGIPLYAKGGTVSRETADANKAKFLKPSKVKERLYHGTKAHDDYAEEAGQAFAQFTGKPTWLAKEPYTASGYSAGTGSTYPVHAQVKKPLALRFDANDSAKKAFPVAKRFGVDIDHMVRTRKPERAWEVINDPAFIDAVEAAGYDGLSIAEDGYKTYGVFDPRKIKSAIGNRGTYDPNEPDINKAEGGVVKGKVTLSPNMDVMQYELLNRKAK